MSNVKKPEPVAWRTRYQAEPEMIGNYPWSYTDYDPKRLAFNPEKESLVTTDQAEAYKDACVREALEQAAKKPREYALQLEKSGWGNRFPDELTAIFNAADNMADRIRALIPKQ